MRNKILDILYENKGNPVSGQTFADTLGVSRTAVWKHIKSLTAEGYDIKSSGGVGYSLAESDVLNEYELSKRLGNDIPFIFKDSVDSTNTLAKMTASDNEAEFMLVTAGVQNMGRGRLGRNFESGNNRGAWCSFVLKPDMAPEEALMITVASATAVCKTLEEARGLQTGIKWPNDIVSGGRKICGILSEMTCETGAIEYIVVGIGINVGQEKKDFSPEVAKTATSLFMETGARFRRADIICSLCYNMQEVYGLVKEHNTDEILRRWSKYTVTDGKMIKVIKNGVETTARAIGIDEKGRLLIEQDGVTAVYNSGEISVRGIMGYI